MSGRTKSAVARQAEILGLKFQKGNKYKYVYKDKKKYVVQFINDGKKMNFGTFDSEEEAAKVAKEKAIEYGKAI